MRGTENPQQPDAWEIHPWGYSWRDRLKALEMLRFGEGEATYTAVGEDSYWIVHDSGTMIEYLDEEEDADTIAQLIVLARYDDHGRWQTAADSLRRAS